jgi:hypothetical protein
MRVGISVSVIGHAAIFAFGLIAFPDALPFAPEEIEALPVELVDVAEMTDLLEGDRNSEEIPEEEPQPTPEVESEVPIPEPPQEEAVEQPVEAVQEAEAPPPPPEPEPEPEPTLEELAALPEPQETAPPATPEPEAPVEPNLPRARPNPPRPVIAEPTPAPKPPEPQPIVPEEQEPEREFNPDDIAALLNKQEPAGGGVPVPSPEPQTLGSIDGQPDAAMTQSEIAALKARLYRCWNPPIGVREAGDLIVEVRISLLPDGSLAGDPMILTVENASNPLAHIAAEAAIRAVQQCAPYGDILRPETYAVWNQIDFVFDPREMLGG